MTTLQEDILDYYKRGVCNFNFIAQLCGCSPQHVQETINNHKRWDLAKSQEKPVLCICPRCKVKHKKMMFWTGTSTPRFYCHDCKYLASHCHDVYSIGYNDSRERVVR